MDGKRRAGLTSGHVINDWELRRAGVRGIFPDIYPPLLYTFILRCLNAPSLAKTPLNPKNRLAPKISLDPSPPATMACKSAWNCIHVYLKELLTHSASLPSPRRRRRLARPFAC